MGNRLTKAELDAVIGVAGDADAYETLRCGADDEDALQREVSAFESGMEKLRRQLAGRTRPASISGGRG